MPLATGSQTVRAGLSSRLGGVSRGSFASLNLGTSTADDPAALAENRRRFAAAARLDPDRTARMRQVHGGRVVIVTQPGSVGEADGLVTAADDLPLLVTVADCMPVLLHEPVAGVIGALHAGWRGVLAGVLEAGVGRVGELGGQPDRLRIWIGPAIGPCCFEVGPEVAARFAPEERVLPRRRAGDAAPAGDRTHVDLPLAARRRLSALGVPAEAVVPPPTCTHCRTDLFFSARSGEPTGRMVGFIVQRRPAPDSPGPTLT